MVTSSQGFLDMRPFIERPKPELLTTRTVGGLDKKTAVACWQVLKQKCKFSFFCIFSRVNGASHQIIYFLLHYFQMNTHPHNVSNIWHLLSQDVNI